MPVLRRLLPALLLAALAGCGGAPPTAGPSGVDGLTIPTPSPDPADFVSGVDNPWLPVSAGSSWTYRVSGGGPVRRVEVRALPSGPVVEGVATTEVLTTEHGRRGRVLADRSAYLAQDRAGNVWLLGESGPGRAWVAGEQGAEAGLAMPAVPRVGDAYQAQDAPGVAQDRVTVRSLDETVSTGAGTLEGLLLTEVASALSPGTAERWYAPHVGLVQELSTTGGLWTLVSHRNG